MKRSIVIMLLCSLFVGAEEEYREFTDQAGRIARLMVTGCDLQRNEVTVESEDHRRITVSITGFSEADQAYIREWYMAHELISARNLLIECDETLVRTRREDVMGLERVGSSRSDETEYTMLGHKRYEEIAYKIDFENRNDSPIQNIRLEYIIYYEQSERGFVPRPQQVALKGKMELPDLEPKKEVEILTDTFEIYTDDLSTRATVNGLIVRSGQLKNADAEVHGMRARLYIKLPSGKEGIREFYHPPLLSEERFPWTEFVDDPAEIDSAVISTNIIDSAMISSNSIDSAVISSNSIDSAVINSNAVDALGADE